MKIVLELNAEDLITIPANSIEDLRKTLAPGGMIPIELDSIFAAASCT